MFKNKANVLTVVVVAACLAGLLFASPRGDVFTKRVYTDDGNTRVPFVVSVASTAWTSIYAANVNRRYAIVHTTSTSTVDICLSTTTTAAAACTTATPGIKLGQVFEVFEDHSQAALYGRTLATTPGSVYLYGEYQYDSNDNSSFE